MSIYKNKKFTYGVYRKTVHILSLLFFSVAEGDVLSLIILGLVLFFFISGFLHCLVVFLLP